MTNKLRIGWFSFTCCEDSTIIFTELLNKHYKDWFKKIEFVHARILMKKNTKEIKEMDVAFIEGALNSPRHVETVKEIRKLAKKVVAIGACACTGLPSVQRNSFNTKQTAEIQPLLDKFDFLPKGQKLAEVITVDAMVPGCPMDEKKFLAVLDAALKEFHII